MGRGPLLRTKVKAEKALTKARLQAKKEWESHKSNIQYRVSKAFEKMAEKFTLDDLICLGVGAWAAKHTNDPLNALHGMIGYKLAVAPNLPTSMVGVAILAAVGIGGLPMYGEDTVMLQPPEEDPPVECPEGYLRKWSMLGGWQCVKVHP